jgi:hypothetical protein
MMRSSHILAAAVVLLLAWTVSASAASSASVAVPVTAGPLPFAFRYTWSVQWQLVGASGTENSSPSECVRMQNNTSGGELPVNFFSVLFALEEVNMTGPDIGGTWKFGISITLFPDAETCSSGRSWAVAVSDMEMPASDVAALVAKGASLDFPHIDVPPQQEGSLFKGLQGRIEGTIYFADAPSSSSSTGASDGASGSSDLQHTSHAALIASLCILFAVLLFACVFARRRQQEANYARDVRQQALNYSTMA